MEQHIGTLIFIIILILASSFFSASETAYTSANKIRLRSLADEGKKSAERALKIISRYDKILTTILVGNNIVNILTSSLATVMCIALWGDNGSLISTLSVTIVVLIFGEILPKTIAKAHAERFACAISGIMNFLMIVFTPISALFLLLQRLATKLFCSKNKEVSMTEQELIHIIEEIEDEGVLEEQESSLVRSALTFDETLVSSILTPRVNVVAIEINSDIENVKEIFTREEYSRIPVYEKTIDHIVGVVTRKELFENLVHKKSFYLRDIIQETLYVPSLSKISDVLKQMQKKKIHLAVVVDQYGGTEGIVTLEDVLEELVGEIYDESDEIKSPVTFLSENVFETGGDLSRNDFNRYFENRGDNFRIDSDSNTVGGWIFELFGKIPEEGEVVTTENFIITVKSIKNFRVDRLRFEILKKDEEQ
ncbi:MAG: hemolysin family protein [Ruminiclostridium sp.]